MRRSMLKKVIPIVFLGAVSGGSGHGMEDSGGINGFSGFSPEDLKALTASSYTPEELEVDHIDHVHDVIYFKQRPEIKKGSNIMEKKEPHVYDGNGKGPYEECIDKCEDLKLPTAERTSNKDIYMESPDDKWVEPTPGLNLGLDESDDEF